MKLKYLLLFVLVSFPGFCQELPPVINFNPNQYNAGNQNWMVSQGENGNFYFANGAGLLEYDGEKWTLYPVPNNSIVRSVKAGNGRIYTGAYMEVGYWLKNNYGTLEYHSLIEKFPNGVLDGELFWNIELLEGLVIFRSFAGIYFYDPQKDTLRELEIPEVKPVSGIFKLENNLYFQLVGGGLYTIVNGLPKIVIPYSQLKDVTIKHLYGDTDMLRYVTGNSGFFKWNGNVLEEFNKSLSAKIQYTNIFAALELSNGNIVLGTVGKGIFLINENGDILHNLSQENILLNNTTLSLGVDPLGNIWAGLDFGISMIDPTSPFRSFQDINGQIGSVYASVLKNGYLYLGTNQGLYVKAVEDGNFELIEGTNGQVWSLNEIDGSLFSGHDTGTFLIEGKTANKISDRLGTWFVRKIKDHLYVQGHYYGFSFLKEKNGKFYDEPLIKDFPHSSRYIEVDSDSTLWVNSEHKGVFKVKYDKERNVIEKLKNYRFPDSIWATSSMFKFADTLYYSTKTKIYQYDRSLDEFTSNNRLNDLVSGMNRISGKMINNGNKRLWGFAENYFFYLRPSGITGDYEKEIFYVDETFRNIPGGYENISLIGDNEYLLGIANGYRRFKDNPRLVREHHVNISQIKYSALDSIPQKADLMQSGEYEFNHNNFSFQFTAQVYNKFTQALYSYRLIGLSENWSVWDQESEANFENLGFGDYSFEVRARVGDEITPEAKYDFSINRPFYLSNLAIAFYSILFILIVLLFRSLNRRYHKRQIAENDKRLRMKKLEAEQVIISLKNEKLEQDMLNKNRELAVSTMSLIKKNEFLTSIKEKLKDSGDASKIISVIKTIDKDINQEDNWNLFKEAFNNADKDFFKKMKTRHPNLTSNDLKLCAYLRLNLSSKEITPLLNISVKSVEIKRYRLRKKMNLDRNVNLSDYILKL